MTEDHLLMALTGVSMAYGRPRSQPPIRVLRSVDLQLHHTRMVCVAGRSGSGKTTLLNIAAGLVRPTEGSVRWGAAELNELNDDELAQLRRRCIGFVFQNGGLITSLTASENVALPDLPRRLDEDGHARARRCLEKVGLAERWDHFPAQLSGGEQQRVALARALFADAPALLVDEPTANLDRATANEIAALLTALRGEGRALLIASHDAAIIERADAVLELD